MGIFTEITEFTDTSRANGNFRFKNAKFHTRDVRIFPKIPVIETKTLYHQVSKISFN